MLLYLVKETVSLYLTICCTFHKNELFFNSWLFRRGVLGKLNTDRGTLGKLKVKLVDPLQYPLCFLQSLTALDRQLSQSVPLVTDALQERETTSGGV